MKKLAVILLLISLIFTTVFASGTATETEETDAPPTDTGETVDLTNTFLNINIWLFSAALILFIICTVGVIIYKTKKSGT